MTVYYSEFDPFAAAWLRELIKEGLIADGEVDERDLWDVAPADLRGFRQVHLCAGIAVWSHALRAAGVADDEPVWTASFPCQPFSAAGKGAGFADQRHLWPAGFHLIAQCRPDRIFGEQVSSKDGLAWLDLVSADLEGTGYAVGALDTCAAGVGAPHIRQRLYWTAERLADAERLGRERGRAGEAGGRPAFEPAIGPRDACRLAHHHEGLEGRGQPGRERAAERPAGAGGVAGGLADADGRHPGAEGLQRGGEQRQQPQDGGAGDGGRPGPVNGIWRDADWLLCRDGRWRPVEPGTFPLAHGAPARVGRLRGYGNAIVAAQAEAFIRAVTG